MRELVTLRFVSRSRNCLGDFSHVLRVLQEEKYRSICTEIMDTRVRALSGESASVSFLCSIEPPRQLRGGAVRFTVKVSVQCASSAESRELQQRR